MILFIVAFFIVVGIGIIVAAKLTFGKRTRADELPLGCENIGNKIQCTAFD